jgi:hypothetical protein
MGTMNTWCACRFCVCDVWMKGVCRVIAGRMCGYDACVVCGQSMKVRSTCGVCAWCVRVMHGWRVRVERMCSNAACVVCVQRLCVR